MIDYVSNSVDNESEVYVVEFVWSSIDKTSSCASLKPSSKGQK
jgi:hypothetical protein